MDKRLLKKLHTHANEVIAAYENGVTLSALGKQYSCSPSTVAALLEEWNVPRRRRGPKGK